MDALLFPILIFGAAVAIGVVAVFAFGGEESVVTTRLHALASDGRGAAAPAGTPGAQKTEGTFFGGLAKRIGDSAKKMFEGGGDETEHRLAMAGFNPQVYTTTFHGTRMMVGMGAATFGALFMLLTGKPVGQMVLAAVGGLIAGMLLPNFWLSIKIGQRRELISASLPNMVDLLVVCVEAGLGLDAAMSRVGDELALSAPELSHELNQLGRELTGGQTHEHALSRLAWRIGIEDVDNLVSMLIQAERFGTSIAVSLRVFSDSFRTARRQRVEEAAAKTTVKLLFPLVFFIFPAIFVILLGPAAVNIMTGGGLK